MDDDEPYSPREATRDALAFLNSQYVDEHGSTDLMQHALDMALADDDTLSDGLTRLLLGMTSIAKMLTQWRENETGQTAEQTMQQLGAFIASMPER